MAILKSHITLNQNSACAMLSQEKCKKWLESLEFPSPTNSTKPTCYSLEHRNTSPWATQA